MGLHGGGYTFLHPEDLTWLTDADVQHMFTIKTTFLMRIRKTDGTQPYAVLSQLSQYSSTPLMIGLNHNTNYNDPQNKASLSIPYLYFGFLPKNIANRANAQQGMTVNFFANTYNNCDGNPNNYIALFPNFNEIIPTNYASHATFPFCNTLFAKHQINPSRRVMPGGYFMFAELHFGGCGCYSQIGRIPDVLSAAIGFKWEQIQEFCIRYGYHRMIEPYSF